MKNYNLVNEDYLFRAYRNVDIRNLTSIERLTFCECRDLQSWKEWNVKQRKRKRDQILRIFKRLELPFPVLLLDQFLDKLQEQPCNQKKPITGNLRVVYKASSKTIKP